MCTAGIGVGTLVSSRNSSMSRVGSVAASSTRITSPEPVAARPRMRSTIAMRSSPSSMPRKGSPIAAMIDCQRARRVQMLAPERRATSKSSRTCSATIESRSDLPVPAGPTTSPIPSPRRMHRSTDLIAASICCAGW